MTGPGPGVQLPLRKSCSPPPGLRCRQCPPQPCSPFRCWDAPLTCIRGLVGVIVLVHGGLEVLMPVTGETRNARMALFHLCPN